MNLYRITYRKGRQKFYDLVEKYLLPVGRVAQSV